MTYRSFIRAHIYPRYQEDMHEAREKLLAGSQVIQTPSGFIEYASARAHRVRVFYFYILISAYFIKKSLISDFTTS